MFLALLFSSLVLRSSRVLSVYSLCCTEFFSLSGCDAVIISLSPLLFPPSLPFLGLLLVYVGFLSAISYALFFHEGSSCYVLSSSVSMRLLFLGCAYCFSFLGSSPLPLFSFALSSIVCGSLSATAVALTGSPF